MRGGTDETVRDNERTKVIDQLSFVLFLVLSVVSRLWSDGKSIPREIHVPHFRVSE